MKRNTLKRLVAAMLSISCICCAGTATFAEDNPQTMYDDGIAPVYIAIYHTYTNLSSNSNGSLNCDAATSVAAGNYTKVVAELQRYDGGWYTIKTWSDASADYAAVDTNWFVAGGYSYRLKTTHYAYDGNWSYIESTTVYSRTISK